MTPEEEAVLLNVIKLLTKANGRLDKRVRRLTKDFTKAVLNMAETGVLESRNETIRDASFDALLTIVREIAEHEGISREEFQKHYDTRYASALDWRLRKAEDISPSHAAEIDERTKAEIEADDPDPLFPPPPDNEN